MNIHSKIALRNLLISTLPQLAEFYEHVRLLRFSRKWRTQGWSVPLPYLIKRSILKAEALRNRAEILIETGTFLGDTPWFFRRDFQQIISIEVDPTLVALAKKRFRQWPNVSILEGDSATILPKILPDLKGRIAFWLDGHYSAGITGRGKKDCPIWEELGAITNSCQDQWTLLIDDARCFGTDPAYPTIEEVRTFLTNRSTEHSFRVENDVIFFTPTNLTNHR
ncbi:MAG: hypothetical protein BWK78_01130 [Thiotrichaceae bacterium IS1]|nr:MAG: hypothetical protein BWK78_01130 [Thiotrichaceae bacterium IS1]